jgi:hypothetical protein
MPETPRKLRAGVSVSGLQEMEQNQHTNGENVKVLGYGSLDDGHSQHAEFKEHDLDR